MNSQAPATGIALTHEFDKAASYHVECDCSDSEHAVKMWIDVDNADEYINVSFYVNTWTPFWETGFNRIKTAWKVLTTGSHQQQHCMILNKQSALNLAAVINSKINELENNK